MKHAIQVAHLVSGELLSIRTLHRRRESGEALAAMAFVGLIFATAMGLVTGLLMIADRLVYAPLYAAIWLGAAALATGVAGRRALLRARRYTIGAALDNDAFAGEELDLVRRTPGGDGYDLGISSGMSGTFAAGRSPIPIESLAGDRGARVPLGAEARAEITSGPTTFVVRAVPFDDVHQAAQNGGARTRRSFFKPFVRPALAAMQLTAVVSLFCATRVGAAITEADMRSSIPATASPWEIEKMLRAQAQNQSRTLHRCFDEMPLECQRPGYVAVGVALSREGEIRSNWVSRSTFGASCPVDQCMADVISTWFFEPLPAAMRVVLPVQVLRTDKVSPFHTAHAAAVGKRACGFTRGMN